MDKAIKIFRNPLFMIITGAVFGILAKYGDIAYANSIFSFFGLLTSGFAIWLVIGTAIIYISSSRKQLSVLLSSFMLPMLLAYYIFSVLAVKYFNIKIALFWCAAFACSLAIGNIIFPKRHTRLFVALFILASAAFVTADAIMINGVNLLLILCESALCIAAAILISRKIKSQS